VEAKAAEERRKDEQAEERRQATRKERRKDEKRAEKKAKDEELKFAIEYFVLNQPLIAQPKWAGNMLNLLQRFRNGSGVHVPTLYPATITMFRY
jgi:hypothetical protein